jgi:hypothetical protein
MKQFCVARDVLESQFGGPIAPTKYVEKESNYDPPNKTIVKQCQKTVSEEFLAVLYLKNANQKKYGSILQGLNTQQSLHNDQYPKTIINANNVLSNHKFDNYKSQARTKISPTRTPRMIKKTKTNKMFPCHLPSSKEDATVVASQVTDHLIVKRKTRFHEMSGPSTRLKPATSKHLRTQIQIITQVLDHKYKEAVMLLNGPESILDSIKPVQCEHAYFWTMSPVPRSSVTLIWLPTFDRPTKSLP